MGATTLVTILVCVAICHAVKWHQLSGYSFEHFKSEFNPVYRDEDETRLRKQIFELRLHEIKGHNMDPTKSWKMGVNRLADRTEDELKNLRGWRHELLPKREQAVWKPESVNIDVSVFAGANVDWRQKGVISSVKDQGMCGSCWSFATAENLEAYWALKTGQLTDLSEQQVLDCTPNPQDCGGTGGCGGGTVELAYTEIVKHGGLASEWTYPYQSYQGNNFQCRYSSNAPPFAKITGYKNLPSNEYAPLLQHVATVGPLAISVDASSWSFYESGVFDGCNKTNPDLDHAVQLVGFGTDSSYGDYWLVRNSWSPNWGEDGYIRLKRSEKVECGEDLTPSDGDGCNGGPSTVTVCGTCGILYDTVYPIAG